MRPNRRTFVAAASAVALGGCLSRGTPDGDQSETVRTAPPATPPGPYNEPPTDDPRHPIPMSREALRENAVPGGPPKDGIESIDDPIFRDAGDAELLDPGDPVFGLEREGVAKAYPQKVLVSNEICNDVIAGYPVSVTYCPLTGTAMGFNRRGTSFGVSGRLINNNLVMYDRERDTWWPQMLATSIPAPSSLGDSFNQSPDPASLQEFRLVWTTWERWRDRYPETRVLTGGREAFGAGDSYGSYNPKNGYYADDNLRFPRLHTDERFQLKRVVLGTRSTDGAAAFLKDSLREAGSMEGDLDGDPIVAVFDPDLDTGYVYRNPEERTVTLEDGQARVEDSTHDPDALPLERVYAFDAMWFAWIGYYPDSNVYE